MPMNASLKLSPDQGGNVPGPRKRGLKTVQTGDSPVNSPARQLQENLSDHMQKQRDQKVAPIVTIAGVALVCAAFWYVLARFIF